MRKGNKIVVLAGGVGSRLSPLSSREKPKQFLYLLEEERTQIQILVDTLLKHFDKEDLYVVTYKDYKDLAFSQLDNRLFIDHIILEPERKNTAPAIVTSLAYLYRTKTYRDRLENVCFIPADHYIGNTMKFLNTLDKAFNSLQRLSPVLIGVKPTRPETGYGYIAVNNSIGYNGKSIKSFKEKPNKKLAEKYYVMDDMYWNTGIYAFNYDHLVNSLHRIYEYYFNTISIQHFMTMDKFYDITKEFYENFNDISFDKAIMEDLGKGIMIEANFKWSDIGTWDRLEEATGKEKEYFYRINGRD